jgi:putative ABC transport system substrate-binding protein
MMKRRDFITLLGSAAAWPLAARAQQPDRVRHVGVLMGIAETNPDGKARITAFRNGLQALGWNEGRNIHIEYRWSAGDTDRAMAFAGELLELTPDVLLATASPPLAALVQKTRTIPIVFLQVSDPVGQGFVQSLARPGGNVTGFANFEFSMMGKWLEFLKEVAPSVNRVVLLFNPDTAPYAENFLRLAVSAAPSFDVELVASPVHDNVEIEDAVVALARKPGGGVIVIPDTFITVRTDLIVSLSARHRLPAVYPNRLFADSGGLMSYGVENVDLYRRAASYVDRILRGEKPADLPVQQPTKFELVINLKTAKALGLTVPLTLQVGADEVIE